MFFTSVKKSVATTVAAGGLLAASLVAGPATVTATTANMACGGYQSGVATATSLNLKRYVARQGQRNRARVHVVSEAGNPNGYVRITAFGFRSKLVKLNANDRASMRWKMSRRGTYEVTATFLKQGCFESSEAPAQFYTVKKKRR